MVDNGGSVELHMPDGSKLEVTWEESVQRKQQREEKEQGVASQKSSANADQELPKSADKECSDIADQHSYEGDESRAE